MPSDTKGDKQCWSHSFCTNQAW